MAAIVYSTPERDQFFSIPVSMTRRRAQLSPPLPGQPGPFSFGQPGVLEEALSVTGFRELTVERVDAPLCLSRFETPAGFVRPCELLVVSATR
ncbi:MAG: hypothetical protein M3P53_12115 [Actinomycetota bacterium]|nr:hypothetical protein [Actinomycetota bacterium]